MAKFRNLKRKRSTRKKSRKGTRKSVKAYVRRPQRIHNRRNNPTSFVQRGIFPNKKLVKLTYVETIPLNPGTTSVVSYRFLSNDLYDPNVTGTGHQYRGFDELCEFYSLFHVIGNRIQARFMYANAGGAGGLFCGVFNNPRGETVPPIYHNLIEAGRTSWDLRNFDSIANVHPLLLTNNYSTKRDKSVTNVLDEPSLGCTSSASPSNKAYFDVCVQPIDILTDQPALYVNVIMTAVVVCSRPRQLTPS